jgi:hypothetical protein
MRIFLSYTTRDGIWRESSLKCIAASLPRPFSIFIDILHNDSFDVQSRINSEIENCDAVVGLVTPLFFKSPWVCEELKIARYYSKRIIMIDVNRLDENMTIGRAFEYLYPNRRWCYAPQQCKPFRVSTQL